jgi:hypothetical protein
MWHTKFLKIVPVELVGTQDPLPYKYRYRETISGFATGDGATIHRVSKSRSRATLMSFRINSKVPYAKDNADETKANWAAAVEVMAAAGLSWKGESREMRREAVQEEGSLPWKEHRSWNGKILSTSDLKLVRTLTPRKL